MSDFIHQAMDHFRLAARMNPQHALARYNCAVVYTTADLLQEAEAELEALITLYPDFPEAFNEIGVVFLRENRLLEAAGQFRRAVDAMPRSAPCRANLALTYLTQGDFSAAQEQARYACALHTKFPTAHDVAGRVALELREYQRAIDHLSALSKLEPSNPEVHANLGLAYYRDNRLNEAIECYQRALVFAPHSPEGHNALGLAYAKNKMLGEAITHLCQVVDWRPDSPIVRSNLGLVYYFKGSSEHAVEQWMEVTRLSPLYARKREATRLSAYDDQELGLRPLDLRKRVAHYPLKIAAFRHSFQLALDENDYRLEFPSPDLLTVARGQERAHRARQAMIRV
jgi:Flp pilus assembly protein TadD